jgi:hypothetical protein
LVYCVEKNLAALATIPISRQANILFLKNARTIGKLRNDFDRRSEPIRRKFTNGTKLTSWNWFSGWYIQVAAINAEFFGGFFNFKFLRPI